MGSKKKHDDIVPNEIELKRKDMECPYCFHKISSILSPDWMGNDFYKDMCKYKDDQLGWAYKRIRELEEALGPYHVARIERLKESS